MTTESFWGDPRYAPSDRDVVKFVGIIRDATSEAGAAHRLKLSTSALFAIVAFVVHERGPKEALSLLDKLRHEIISNEFVRRFR